MLVSVKQELSIDYCFICQVLGNKYQSKLLEIIDARWMFFSVLILIWIQVYHINDMLRDGLDWVNSNDNLWIILINEDVLLTCVTEEQYTIQGHT